MTYAAYETSEHGGEPIELYRFRIAGITHLFTSAQEDYTDPQTLEVYTSKAIKRSDVSGSGSALEGKVTLELPFNDLFTQTIEDYSADTINTVDIWRLHLTDPDAEIAVLWAGRIVQRKRSKQKFQIICEPIQTYFNRSGLRGKYQRICRHALYKHGCAADQNAVVVIGAGTQVANILTVAEALTKPAGYFDGGYVKIQGTNISRMIIAHATDQLTLPEGFNNFVNGTILELYPGCDRSYETCRDKFNNTINYGGFPWIPYKNPFGGIEFT